MKSTATETILPTAESADQVNGREVDAWSCEDCGHEVADISAHVGTCPGQP